MAEQGILGPLPAAVAESREDVTSPGHSRHQQTVSVVLADGQGEPKPPSQPPAVKR